MKINSYSLADVLEIDPAELRRKCTLPRGYFIGWLTREILLNEWMTLNEKQRNYLLGMLKVICQKDMVFGALADDLFNNGYLVYDDPFINKLALIYSKQNNPFDVEFGRVR